jgi:hypothetical protein
MASALAQYVRAIGRYVRNGKKRDEFVDDGALVLLAPLARRQGCGICLSYSKAEKREEANSDTSHWAALIVAFGS